MSNARPPYPPEFREQMVELVPSDRSPEELAREFEPSAQAIRNWISQADRNEGRGSDGLTSVERDELRRLKRENRQLRQEGEILAESSAFAIHSRINRLASVTWSGVMRPATKFRLLNIRYRILPGGVRDAAR